jgi:30S ribosomal protein S31
MGKGDKKSRRGKIVNGTYGRLRPRKKSSGFAANASADKAVVADKPAKKVAAKTETEKKPAAKKPAAKKAPAKKTEE